MRTERKRLGNGARRDDGELPATGTLARDTQRGRVGVVVAHQEGGWVQLRAMKGALEWVARPEHVRPTRVSDELRARVKEANERSRGERL